MVGAGTYFSEIISKRTSIPFHSPRRILDSNYDDNWCIDTHSNHYAIIEIEEGDEYYSRQKVKVYNKDGSIYWE